MENTTPQEEAKSPKTVKAVASSPVLAKFDIIQIDGKDVVVGQIGFLDQFGMERIAKTAGEKGVLNLGKHVLAIFNGHVDITEPDEETKQKLKAEHDAAVAAAKEQLKEGVKNAYDNGQS